MYRLKQNSSRLRGYILFYSLLLAGSLYAGKAPFRVLFNHDLLYMGKESPWNPDNENPISVEQMLRCSVDEVAGAGCDVITFAPGYGYVPFWKSDIYPYRDHIAWWDTVFILPHHRFTQYMLDGGDMVAVFIDQCRAKQISPFITIRLNDLHMLEYMPLPDGSVLPGTWADLMLDRWRREHTHYGITRPEERTLLGPDPVAALKQPGMIHKIRREQVMNWIHPEVRDRVYAFIEEVCTKYDMDGIELDFMRESLLFRTDETTGRQRKKIILDFITRVRNVLDKSSAQGRHRWLLARVPAFTEAHDALGIEIQSMAARGVDMFTLSHYFRSYQQSDLAKISSLVPDKAVYLEMTYATQSGRMPPGLRGVPPFRRTTEEQFYTAANLVYSRGGQGISLFNFPYYRGMAHPSLETGSEPPYHVIPNLANPADLTRKPQHYILYGGWHYYISQLTPLSERIRRMIPGTLRVNQDKMLDLDMALPDLPGEGDPVAILRVQVDRAWAKRSLTAYVNGRIVLPYADTSEPFPNPYPPLLGTPEQKKAWKIPFGILRDGMNEITLKMIKGDPILITFLDIAIKEN